MQADLLMTGPLRRNSYLLTVEACTSSKPLGWCSGGLVTQQVVASRAFLEPIGRLASDVATTSPTRTSLGLPDPHQTVILGLPSLLSSSFPSSK